MAVVPDWYCGVVKKKQIEKLSKEIAELDSERLERGDMKDRGLTLSEKRFAEIADSKGKKLFRSGWPDFLCLDMDEGGVVCVEVKYNDDEVRPSQCVMFAALEKHLDLRVMVWDPRWPDKLVGWRKYRADRDQRLAGLQGERGPRQPTAPRSMAWRSWGEGDS